jgi:hypothetical protein
VARKVINPRVARMVRVFKWGGSEELVPESVWRALTTVKGRSKAKEAEPIKPVAVEVVEKTIPHLHSHLQ